MQTESNHPGLLDKRVTAAPRTIRDYAPENKKATRELFPGGPRLGIAYYLDEGTSLGIEGLDRALIEGETQAHVMIGAKPEHARLSARPQGSEAGR